MKKTKRCESVEDGVSCGESESKERVVLVGTYRGDQLSKWRGWYNYPISDEDKIGAADAAKITELWLFKGLKDQRNYRAAFVGVRTRQELIDDYGYPAKGKAHGDKYLLFKTEFKYRHKGEVPEDAEQVIVCTADFATAPKVRKQLKAYLESPDRKDPDLANRLPEIVTKLRPEQLRVCDGAIQLNFFDDIVPQVTKLVKRNATGGRKFTESAMRCLYFENGICCESDSVGEEDLEAYFRDSFKCHVGKSASEKSVRQYLSHQPVIAHNRALIHYWECA